MQIKFIDHESCMKAEKAQKIYPFVLFICCLTFFEASAFENLKCANVYNGVVKNDFTSATTHLNKNLYCLTV